MRTLSFLSPDFFQAIALGVATGFALGFKAVEQLVSREETIESLLAGRLTFDLNAGGPMSQHDARGDLVDVLTAVSARANEGFVEINLANAERGHPLGELIFFFQADGERAHETSGVIGGIAGKANLSGAQLELGTGRGPGMIPESQPPPIYGDRRTIPRFHLSPLSGEGVLSREHRGLAAGMPQLPAGVHRARARRRNRPDDSHSNPLAAARLAALC